MVSPRSVLALALLVAAELTLSAAARPIPLALPAHRLLGQKALPGGGGGGKIGVGGGGSGGVRIGGAIGGGGSGPYCSGLDCNTSLLSTLAILNSQDAVRRAIDDDRSPPGLPAFQATQSAARSSVAANFNNFGFLANQQLFEGQSLVGKK